MISNLGTGIFMLTIVFYLLVIGGGIALAIWGFVTLLRIQTNTREMSSKLDRIVHLLEQQATSEASQELRD